MFGSGMVYCAYRIWMVSIAGTYEQILRGLKGVKGLPYDTALLCNYGDDCLPVVDTDGMLFSTDIVFVSSAMEVVDIYREVTPGSKVASRASAQYYLQMASTSACLDEFRKLGFSEEDIEDLEEDLQWFPKAGASVFVSYFMLPTEE